MAFILAAGIVALVAWLAWRGARERYEEARRNLERRKRDEAAAGARAVTLERDPATGVYRERRD